MTIDDLIIEGEQIRDTFLSSGGDGTYGYIIGVEPSRWVSKAITFLENEFGEYNNNVQRFSQLIKSTEDTTGIFSDTFDKLIGIIKGFAELPPKPQAPGNFELLSKIMRNFDKFVTQIKRRREDRDTIKITDEYDVQDAIHAILKLFVDDIRPEEWAPSYAGGSARMDFLLPDEKLVIETKMTRDTLKDKKLGDELIIDIEKYKQHSECNHLICFIYDKESHIHNPAGLKKDLENQSSDQIKVTVVICPE